MFIITGNHYVNIIMISCKNYKKKSRIDIRNLNVTICLYVKIIIVEKYRNLLLLGKSICNWKQTTNLLNF